MRWPLNGDRLPKQKLPSDEQAERFVLGSILLDGTRYASVTGAITHEAFSLTKHQLIWTRMAELAERSETINRATLADALLRNDELSNVSLSYIVSLDEGMPAVSDANLQSYVGIVVEKWRLRKAIYAAQKTITQATSGEYSANDVALNGQAMLAEEVGGHGSSQIESVREFVETFPGGVNLLLDPSREDHGIPTGFRQFDDVTDGFHAGEIFLIGARPRSGKTALASCIAKTVARGGNSVVVFTLELSKKMFLRRMICEESYVSFSRFRTGELDDEDRRRVREGTAAIMDMPLYVDDSSGARVADLRVKLNRVIRHHPVNLMVVDYAQLLRPPKGVRFTNENDKFTLIGEELKALSKETGIPLLLLSQLNRESEKSRGDNRPQLDQCRGCLTADTMLWDIRTGCLKSIADIVPGDIVAAMDSQQKIRPFEVKDQWSTGVKTVYLLSTETGKTIIATDSHPFFSETGWKPLKDLVIGEHIGSAWKLPAMGTLATPATSDIRDDLCRLIGYFVGDGSCIHLKTCTFTNTELALLSDCASIVNRCFDGISINTEAFFRNSTPWYEMDFITDKGVGHYGTNALRNWFRLIGSYGKIHRDKSVPRYVFESGTSGVANFLAGYFATDGCVKFSKRHSQMIIHSDSVSYQLSRDVQMLLMRLGIVSRVGPPTLKKSNPRAQPMYRTMVVPNQHNYRRFAELIPLRGVKKQRLDHGILIMSEKVQKAGLFGISKRFSRELSAKTHWLWKDQKKRMQRSTAMEWAEKADFPELRMWAESDVIWEKVTSIQKLGMEEVYDINVPGANNFIANGYIVHNSGIWEEISFVGACLWREWLHKKDRDDLRNVAQLLMGKNRSGPEITVTLRFIDWLMRFENPEAI